MTITLPFDPSIGDGYDSVPGNNNSPPPQGSPEGQATSTHNDSARDTKAGVNQNSQNIGAVNDALGTMAEQNSTAVSITGGSIGSGVSVALAVDSTALGGLTLQQLYDAEYPVGEGMKLTLSNTPPQPWPGVSATWTRVADNVFIKCGDGILTPGDEFGGVSQTDDAFLTVPQLPQHDHDVFADNTTAVSDLVNTNEFAAARLLEGTSDDYAISASTDQTPAAFRGKTNLTGSGQGHSHTYNNNPPFFRAVFYLRTA